MPSHSLSGQNDTDLTEPVLPHWQACQLKRFRNTLRKNAKKLRTLSYEPKKKRRASSRCSMATIAIQSSRSWDWNWCLPSDPQPGRKPRPKRKQRAKRKPQAKRQTRLKRQRREASPSWSARSHASPQRRQRKPVSGLDSDVLVARAGTGTGTRLRCKFRPSPLFSRWPGRPRRVRFRCDRVNRKFRNDTKLVRHKIRRNL